MCLQARYREERIEPSKTYILLVQKPDVLSLHLERGAIFFGVELLEKKSCSIIRLPEIEAFLRYSGFWYLPQELQSNIRSSTETIRYYFSSKQRLPWSGFPQKLERSCTGLSLKEAREGSFWGMLSHIVASTEEIDAEFDATKTLRNPRKENCTLPGNKVEDDGLEDASGKDRQTCSIGDSSLAVLVHYQNETRDKSQPRLRILTRRNQQSQRWTRIVVRFLDGRHNQLGQKQEIR